MKSGSKNTGGTVSKDGIGLALVVRPETIDVDGEIGVVGKMSGSTPSIVVVELLRSLDGCASVRWNASQ